MRNIKFINDKVVKKILTSEDKENKEYLIRIISGVTGVDKDLLRSNIKLVTNEVSSNVNMVNSLVDTIYSDEEEYINIEINYNYSKSLLVKNNIYVYHMILRQVHKSTDYDNISPVIQININSYDLFKRGKFIYKSEMREKETNEKRDNMITIYDINLDYLRNIDYNKIKKGTIYNLEKILYIFVCDNKNLLDEIYSGDNIMDKVRDDFDMITYETDSILYYNPEDLYDSETKEKIRQAKEEARQAGLKEGIKEGREKGKQEGKLEGIKEGKEAGKLETIKENVINMLKNNVSDELILKYLNIDENMLNNIKKDLG